MINRNTILVLDFETGDKNPYTCPVIQIAALAVNPATLEVYDDGKFDSLINPPDFDNIKDEALLVNNKKRDDIKAAPEQAVIMSKFHEFVLRYKVEKSNWGLPILAGHNIASFDRIILDRLAKLYKVEYVHPNLMLDTYQLSFYWFERRGDVQKYNLDYLRSKFSVNAAKTGAHDALTDCYDTLNILQKYMKLSRNISAKLQFKEEAKP